MKRILTFCMFIALMTLASGCSSNSSELTLKGDIQNNIISSNSTVQGKIIEMKKQQGETVKKGEVIAIIDSVNQKYTVAQLQAVVTMKKAKLEELQAGSRSQQVTQAKNNVSISGEVVDAAQLNYDYISTLYNNTLACFNSGIISKADLDASKFKLDTAATQLSTAKYQLANSKQQLNLLQNASSSQSITSAQADLAQAVAQLSQAQNILSNYNIIAMADGIIISKNFELGDIVNPGSNIADIAVANDLYVVCYVPEKYLDKVYYNQPLTVTTSTGTQTGKVNYIALKKEYTPKDEQSTTGSGNTATKIKVSIKDDKGILKSGMTAKVILPLK